MYYTTPILPCTTKYYSSTTLYLKVLLKYYSVLLQYYLVLQSTTPVLTCTTKYYSSTNLYYTTPILPCTTKYYSSTTLYLKVLLQYYSVLQSTTPILLRTTNTTLYYSSTTLYYKVPLKYYSVLLHYYLVLQSTTPVLPRTTEYFMIDPHHISNVIYNARSNKRQPPTSAGTAPATQNESHDWSASHMKRHLQCAEQQASPSNFTKYCACHAKWISWLIHITYETSFTMRGATVNTLQPHQILGLPRKMNLMIDPHHIWNVIYNARSNRHHPPTSPNTAPATQNESHGWSTSNMKRHLQCAEQQASPSNLTKYCACHAKWPPNISEKLAENRWNVISNARPIRAWSETDPSMIRPRKRKTEPAAPPRLLFALARSRFYWKLQRFHHSKIHHMLRLPRKVTHELHQMLRLPRKVTHELHQMLHLPQKMTYELHQMLHLPQKMRHELHQMLRLPRKVTQELHQMLHLPQKVNYY